ncbi:hypothetical protein ACWEO1_22740 [Kitasatospora cineracea]
MTDTQPPTPDLDTIQARTNAATPGPWYPQTDYGNDFIATQIGGYEHGIGWLNFGAGSQARADREFVTAARTDVPALIAYARHLEARVADLEQQLAKYVGVEPTVREELAEMNRRLDAAEQLIPADPADDDIAPRIAPRTLRAALDGDIPRTARQTHDEWLRCSGLHCPNAERYAKAEERGWLSAGMGQWLCPDCRTTPAPARDGR